MSESINESDSVSERFDKFCNHTNLHGYVYLRRNNPMPYLDRISWIWIIVLNLVLSGFVIYDVWYDWLYDPFTIAYDSNAKAIWEFPFPSVTICTYNAFKCSSFCKMDNKDDLKYLFFPEGVHCENKFIESNLSMSVVQMSSVYAFLREVTPLCQDVIKRCVWEGKEIDCCKNFYPIITDLGLCYIFNSLPSNMLFNKKRHDNLRFHMTMPCNTTFWIPGEGYPQPRQFLQLYPRFSRHVGYSKGLSVELVQQTPCTLGSSGFKVIVNSPEEVPVSSKDAVSLGLGQNLMLRLTPLEISTSKELISTPVARRGCLFNEEKRLDHFNYYTQSHCIQDCLIELFFLHCGCVPYYMPKNKTTPICSKLSDRDCFRTVEDNLVSESIRQNSRSPDDMMLPWCGCYPRCNDITFDFTPSSGFSHSTKPNFSAMDQSSEMSEFSKLSIFYNDLYFFRIIRQSQGNIYDVLGNCGGLLGLLMGFSTIALIDALYHCVHHSPCSSQPGNSNDNISHQKHPIFLL